MWRTRENALKREKGRKFKEAKVFQEQIKTTSDCDEQMGVLRRAAKQQCSSSFSSRPRTAPLHAKAQPSTSHFHIPISTFPAPAQGTSTSNRSTNHTQASTGCSLLRGSWMNMDIKALFKGINVPLHLQQPPTHLQCSDTAMQLWAGVAKHSPCHKTQEFILRLWESLKYLLCSPPKHQNWGCSKRWQHQAPSLIFE